MRFIVLLFAVFSLIAKSATAQKCKTAMSADAFSAYFSTIKSESFSSSQMEAAQVPGRCFSTDQIRQVMNFFSFEENKLEFAKWAYSRCVDQDNYPNLRSALTFSSSRTELSQLINQQAAAKEESEEEPIQPTVRPNPTPKVKPTLTERKKTTPPATRPTGWEPDRKDNEDWDPIQPNQNEEYKRAMDKIKSFFVMTIGTENDHVVDKTDVKKADEKPEGLSPKAPRIVITEPELNEGNNFTARTGAKKMKVSGVVSSTVGIYEVWINENEAVLNQKGEFFGDALLAIGANTITLKVKDTKGQVSSLKFTAVREASEKPVEVVQPTPSPSPSPNPPAPAVDFVSEVDRDIPTLKISNPNAIAVVIGNAAYRKAKPVDFAVNDARSVKTYLVRMLGFREGNILYYENATLGDFNTVFGTKANPRGKLFNSIKQGVSDVFIFYSGHGAPGLKDSKAYFVPVEADPNYMENSGYALEVLYENLKKLPAASITLVSDACFSGADVFDKISPMVIRAKEPVKEGLKNTTLLNSCTGTEVSCWHNEEKHGLFTFYFLKALKNYRSTDLNKDKQISLQEVFTSLADFNEGVPYYARRSYGLTQTPVIQGNKSKILFKYP